MSRITKSLLILSVCLLGGALTASASTFYVQPGGGPGIFADLTTAVNTVGAYAGTDHIIVVQAGTYAVDANITIPANIAEIYGVDKSGVIFTAPLATDKFLITTGAQAGFKLHDMTVKGYERVVNDLGGSGHQYTNIIAMDGAYGIVFSGCSGNLVQGCCFINNSADNGYDDNLLSTWTQNYWDDAAAVPYIMGGGAGSYDAAPLVRENNAVTPATTLEVFDVFNVDIQWSVPACADPTDLAAYEFTVTWNPADIQVVPGSTDYDQAYLGTTADGALYTPIDFSVPGQATFAAANFTTPGVGDGRLAFLQFQVIGTGASTITIASDYRDSGSNPLFVANTPLAMTCQDTDIPVITLLNPFDPVGNNTYSDNGAGTLQLTANIQAQDNFALDRIQYRFDNTGSWINLVTGIPGVSGGTVGFAYINITALTSGAHILNVRARDDAGNYSATSNYAFTRDVTGPVLTSIALTDPDGCAAAGWTSGFTVNVGYVDDGTGTTMQFYIDAGPWGAVLAYPQAQTAFADVEGIHNVWARLIDAYGNVGNQVGPYAINYDKTAPSLTGPFVINPTAYPVGAAKTNVTAVVGNFLAWDANRWKMAVSETVGDMTDCSKYGAITYPVPATLSTPSGVKTLYFSYADSAGNFAAPLSDGIELDLVAPVAGLVTVADPGGDGAGGDDCTDTWNVNVTVTFAATDVVYIKINDGGPVSTYGDGTTIITSPVTLNYNLTGGYGPAPTPATVNVVLVDNATNTGAAVSDVIVVDWQDPTLTSVAAERTTATVAPIFSGASNTAAIKLTLVGLPADATELLIAEDGGAETAYPIASPTDPFDYTYNWLGAITSCTWHNVSVRAVDCAGNKSAVVSDGIYFDLDVPVINSFTGPLLTNNLTIAVANSVTDCGIWQMRMSEDAAFTAVPWVAYAAAGSFTLANTGDGTRTVYLQVADYAGNVAGASIAVQVDQTAPSGTAVLQQNPLANPLATAGYTNSLATNQLVGISATGGAIEMYIANLDWSGATGWIPIATSYSPWALSAGPDGPRTVQIFFRDAALNQSAAILLNIAYDATAPAAPAVAVGVPGGSLNLSWSKVTGAQKYYLRYNLSGDYPLYFNPNPPAPGLAQGFEIGFDNDTSMVFEGPQPDKYHISIWTIDLAGNYSVGYNVDVLETNYVLGDFSPLPDNCLDFANEFGDLATGYNTATGNPNFNDSLDIAPTDDLSATGYPIPDGLIDFEDLIVFAINYDAFRCAFGSPERPSTIPTPAAVGVVELFAEVPEVVNAGDEFVVALTAKSDVMADVKGYHLTFDYDRDVVELVSVQPGAMHTQMEKQFFYVDRSKGTIDITGVAFETAFAAEEVALFTFKARTDGKMTITEKALDLRDRTNARLQGSFVLGTAKVEPSLPKVFALSQNYPNPFNPATTIELALPTASDYTLSIYDITGRTVETFSGFAEAGYLKVEWNAKNHASGVYLYKVVAGSFSDTKKMVLLK